MKKWQNYWKGLITMGRLYLSGGGNAEQTKKIDRKFAREVDGKKIMYIPIALERDAVGFEACLDWITSVFADFEYKVEMPQIEMFLDPKQIVEQMSNFDAIYIGGGNTFKLLQIFYENDISEKLVGFLNRGGLVYGGSAGAIIFGKSIDTVIEENDNDYLYHDGLDLLGGKSIICHFQPEMHERVVQYSEQTGQKVLALPENAGVIIENGDIVHIFNEAYLYNGADCRYLENESLVVCDYDNPKNYTFPSFGMGSSEKRIWHFAKTASKMDGFNVIIAGPNWLPEYVPEAEYFPMRLDARSADEFIRLYGKCDYLFAGMEYFDKDEWVKPFEKCANVLLSYQLHSYQYQKTAFDGKRKILFCYSDEMCKQYKEQKPLKKPRI